MNSDDLQPSEYTTDYRTLVAGSRKDFLGLILDSQTGVITRAFACGVKGNTPFCVEGTTNGSKYSDNQTLLFDTSLYGNTCALVP